jgi:uncharacterized membrane protein
MYNDVIRIEQVIIYDVRVEHKCLTCIITVTILLANEINSAFGVVLKKIFNIGDDSKIYLLGQQMAEHLCITLLNQTYQEHSCSHSCRQPHCHFCYKWIL